MAVKDNLKRVMVSLDEVALRQIRSIGFDLGIDNISNIVSLALEYSCYANDVYIVKNLSSKFKLLSIRDYAAKGFNFSGKSLVRKIFNHCNPY